MKSIKTLFQLLGIALVAAAILQELRKPAGRRTWHGQVAGFVPYDFRPPTVERLRAAFWAPEDPRILTDKVLGVGWSVNVARLAQLSGIDVR